MGTTNTVTYDHGSVDGFGGFVNARASMLMDIHNDIKTRTDALAEFFAGKGATGFFEAQALMLSGLMGLAETVAQHGNVVHKVNDSAMATDEQIFNLF